MRVVTVLRDKIGRKQSSGLLIVQNGDGDLLFSTQSLERGWLNNQKNISCIPQGKYLLEYEYSPKFKRKLWEIYGVPNRRECKIHSANYWNELNGCIAPGLAQKDFNDDGLVDNQYSRDALTAFHKAMRGHTKAVIHVINNRF